MKVKALFSALLLVFALAACTPAASGGDGSQSQPSQAAPSSAPSGSSSGY
jgi:hypothetical protein